MQKPVVVSPLKWAGNKMWLAKRLARLIQKDVDVNDSVVELFAGSLGFSLFYGFNNVIANDVDKPLISFYNHLKSGFIPDSGLTVEKEAYYQYRDRYNDLVESNDFGEELASIFYYINCVGYNGLFRKAQRTGRLNVPFGDYKRYPHQKLQLCKNFGQHVKTWEFTNKCFTQVDGIEGAGLILADPPYEGTFTGYNGKFTFEDQLKVIKTLDKANCPIIATNSIKSKPLIHAYKDAGYSIYKSLVPRRISRNVTERKPEFELIALKNFTTQRVRTLCPELQKIRV